MVKTVWESGLLKPPKREKSPVFDTTDWPITFIEAQQQVVPFGDASAECVLECLPPQWPFHNIYDRDIYSSRVD